MAFAAIGLLQGTQLYVGVMSEGMRMKVSWARIMGWQVGSWLLWAALSPLIVAASRAFPLARRWRPLLAHAGVGLALALVRIAGMVVVTRALQPFGPNDSRTWFAHYTGALSSYLHVDLLVYWSCAGALHALESQRRLRERERAAARIETQLAEARLANLRLQLQPHFLFNTLHSIGSLVRAGDGPAAIDMLSGLSELLRYSLENAGRERVPLSEELEVTQRYLEIQRTRFSDRMQVTYDIEADARQAAVPTLLLQPLVENAVRHGIAASVSGGTLAVRARLEKADLVLEVRADGPPLAPDWRARRGVGLTSTRDRLAQLDGEHASLDLRDVPGGVLTTVRLPFVHAGAAVPGGNRRD